MKKIVLLICILVFYVNYDSFAQKSAQLKNIYKDAEFFFEREDYKEAITLYLQLIDNGFVSANIKFKIGVCYLNMPGEEIRSIAYFEEASKHITTKYRPREIEETKAPLHTLFYLGNAYRINNNLSKALETYDKFTENPGFYGNYNLNIVDNEIKACERAKIIQDSPVDVMWQNLGEPVNTPTSETYPVVSANDSVLVFLSTQKLYNAIFCCKKLKDGTWSRPDNLNPQVMSDGELYPTGLSANGKELFLIRKSITNSDVYISEYDGERWSRAERLGDNVNSSSQENYASLSPDGKTLYFTSNRSGGKGGFDIYTSNRNSSGEWGKAQNLGKAVNSPHDEAAPFLSSDGKTLYFSSRGHFNMGGYDIFYATLAKDKKWNDPNNIGFPVNNTGDNLLYCPVLNGTTGYVSKFSKEGKGREDIYKVEVKSKLVVKESDLAK